MPEPRMRDEFRRELRARLMNEAVLVLAPKRRDNAWTAWLRPALAVGLAVVVLFAGAGVAAAGSLPGDPGFGIKRAVEEIQLALTFGDVEHVKALADLADKRLTELQQVADSADKAPTASEEYAQAVARFRSAVDALRQSAPDGKRDAADQVADRAREKHETVLDELKDRLPDEAKPSLERAMEEERKPAPERTPNPNKDEERPSGRPERTPEPTRTQRAVPTPRGSR